MIPERMLELLVLNIINKGYYHNKDYRMFINENYNIKKIENRYLELGKEFLNDYALNKTEKSE